MTMNLSRVGHASARPDIELGHVVVDLDGKCISSMPLDTAYELLASLGHAIVVREQEDADEEENKSPLDPFKYQKDQLVGVHELDAAGYYK